MIRIQPIDPAQATGRAKQLLDGVQAKLGMTPNLMKTLANSTAALDAYLHFSGSLSAGTLDAGLRGEIAIAVAQANSCQYCLSAHTLLGSMAHLTPEQMTASRQFREADPKRQAALEFAQTVVVQRGQVSAAAVEAVRQAGYTDGEIAEIVGHVALNIFTNYFNNVAGTEIDFPVVSLELPVTA